MTPIYNWMLCSRCKHFSVEIARDKDFVDVHLFCKLKPLAMTGDIQPMVCGEGKNCPDFMPSGKRGFDTRKEDYGRNREQKKQQKRSAEKKKIQRGKQGPEEQDQETAKTLGPLFR